MTNQALINTLVAAAAEIWEIDPVDIRSSPGARAGRARIAIAHFAYRHGCELHEILRGFERGKGSEKERRDFREPVVREQHNAYFTSRDEYRERCLKLMKAVSGVAV